MANRLSLLSSNPELVSYAQGTARQNISEIAEFLAPTVEVSSMTGHFKKFDDKHRFRVPNTKRALRGRATVLEWDVSDPTYNCSPHAIDVPVDKLEGLELGSAMDAIKEGADDAAEVAGLAHEQAVVSAALAAAGGGTNSNFTSDSVWPISVINAQIIAVAKAAKQSNLMELCVLFGPTAFIRFSENKNVANKKTGMNKAAVITMDDVSSLLFGNPAVKLSTTLVDEAAEGLDQSIDFMLDNEILIFVRKSNPTRRDPSFMKTFRLRNNILRPRIYERDDGRVDVAAFDWSEDIQVTNSLAVSRLNATNA